MREKEFASASADLVARAASVQVTWIAVRRKTFFSTQTNALRAEIGGKRTFIGGKILWLKYQRWSKEHPRGGVRAPDLPALRASSGVSAVPGGPVRLQKTLSLGDPFNCDRQASQQIYYDGKNRGFKVSFQKEGLEGKRFMKSCPIGKQGQTMVSNVFGRHGGGVDEALKSCEKWIDANLSVSGIMGRNSVWHKDK